MTSTDIGFWIATGAAVIAAFYSAIAYHRPKASPMAKPGRAGKAQTAPAPEFKRWPVIPIILVVTTWGAVAFDYIDRHWLSSQLPAETPITSDNANLDIFQVVPGFNQELRRQFANIFIVNRGKSTANNLRHIGSIGVPGGIADSNFTNLMFSLLKIQLKQSTQKGMGSLDIQPGQSGVWFSIFSAQQEDSAIKSLDDSKPLFIFNLMKYRDNIIDSNKAIYTETCVYILKSVTHLCESGHNRAYISD
jgi:hypothetical protein